MNSRTLFKEGYNCAQSAFAPSAQKFKIEKELAFKMMFPFGGGICRTDNICGAVSGTIASIGLYAGTSKVGDAENSAICHEITGEFINRFKEEHGSVNCTTLVGYNLSNQEDREKAIAENAFQQKCTKFIESASTILNELLVEKGIEVN